MFAYQVIAANSSCSVIQREVIEGFNFFLLYHLYHFTQISFAVILFSANWIKLGPLKKISTIISLDCNVYVHVQ